MQNELAMLPNLMPVMPEILLAVGAMLLLMLGVFVGERSTTVVTGLSVADNRSRRPRGGRLGNERPSNVWNEPPPAETGAVCTVSKHGANALA